MSSSEDEAESQSDMLNNEPLSFQPLWQLVFFLLLWQSIFRISNMAMEVLLKLLSLFIKLFGKAIVSDENVIADKIPNDIPAAYKFLSKKSDDFISYVVCPNCDCIYDYDDCIKTTTFGQKESKLCRHIAYPNHPHVSRRQECKAQLLKKVRSGKGYKLVPMKEYPYQPLSKSIAYLVKKTDFLEACEKWRRRMLTIPESYLSDIYDGRVWREFSSDSMGNFLNFPYNYLLTINVDWFQPFSRVQYSVGAIYLVVQNLPREVRYRQENVILVGLIPGPREPSLTINSYLAPLVQELQQAWDTGFTIRDSTNTLVTIRLAISCVVCDLPASRKVCGFLGHNSTFGCNKCYKKFLSSGLSNVDYSGYDCGSWTCRNNRSHRENCQQILCETTKTGIKNKEAEFGVRYSIMLELSYFDPVRFTVVDVMHNVFLGTSKHMFKVWLQLDLMTQENLEQVERKVGLFHIPNSIGRLPINIASNYGGFKAIQWQTWVTVYSPVVLKGILPNPHLQCWLLFVHACRILSKHTLKVHDVNLADVYLLQFCKTFEQLYGGQLCTPNMHLHLHLKDCLLDYGPSHAFWTFTFERFNGLLGSVHTNKRSIEKQIMRKFTNAQWLHSSVSGKANPQLLSLLPMHDLLTDLVTPTSLQMDDVHTLELLNMSSLPLSSIKSFGNEGFVKLMPPLYEDILFPEQVDNLNFLYQQLYPNKVVLPSSPFYSKTGRVTLGNELIGSVMNATSCNSCSVIVAYWPSSGNTLSNITYSHKSVGVIQYFIKHQVKLKDSDTSETVSVQHIFAYVMWKQEHIQKDWFGISAIISQTLNEAPSLCSFLPVQRINAVCAYCTLNISFDELTEEVFVAIPLTTKFFL